MRDRWQFLPQHFVTSTIKKMGRDKILGLIDEGNREFEEAVDGGETIP
jgi:GTP-binding protein